MSMRTIKTYKSKDENRELKLLYGDWLGQRHHNWTIIYRNKELGTNQTFLAIPEWHFTDKTKELVLKLFEEIASTYEDFEEVK